jgi:hypothetical protein
MRGISGIIGCGPDWSLSPLDREDVAGELAVGRWDRSQRSVSDRVFLTGKGNRYRTENRSPRCLTRGGGLQFPFRGVVGLWRGWWAAIPFSRPSRVRNKIHLHSEKRTFGYKNYSLYSFIVCRRIKKEFFFTIPILGQRYFRVKKWEGDHTYNHL